MKRSILRGMIFGVILTALLVGMLPSRQAHAASGSNCDNNAVVFCGASSVQGLMHKYNNGDGRNSANSIQAIFSSFGISSSDVQAMGNTAQSGSVTKSGDVFVGNQLVATNALTAGRQNIAGSTRHMNQGTVFFTRPPSVSFASSPLSAFVVMKNGVFQFAVLTSCGNPVTAHPKTPPPAPAPKPKHPPAPAPAPAPKPAPKHTAPSPANVCSGNTSNSNSGIASQGGNCSTNTTVVQTQTTQAAPTQTLMGQCTSMSAAISQDNTLTATAMVNFQTQGGAQLQSITYDFGDSVAIQPTTQTTMSHTYQQAGTYLITATLTFTGSQPVAPSTCQASVTATAPPAPAPPAQVTPTPPPADTSASTPAAAAPAEQTPPTQLVNTGAGSVLGIFGITSVIGTVGYRFFFLRYLRRGSSEVHPFGI